MSETNAPTDGVFAAAPEEAAPAVEGEQQSEACADLAHVTDSKQKFVLTQHLSLTANQKLVLT